MVMTGFAVAIVMRRFVVTAGEHDAARGSR
jgi:hypothetical protein